MRLPLIALRNLARNRRRTALSLVIIACGTAGLVLTSGFVRFSFGGLETALIQGGLGHLEVVTAGTVVDVTERGGAPALADWERVRSEVESVAHVRAAMAVVHLNGMVSHGERSAAFLGIATEPERERRMGFEVRVRGGSDLPHGPPAEGDDRLLLGGGLARVLDAVPGDVVTVLVLTRDGTLNAVDMVVAGLMTTGLREVDNRFLKMHVASASRLVEGDAVSSLVVGLDHTRHTEAAEAAIQARLAGGPAALDVLDWQTRAPFYGQVKSLYQGIFWFLGGIVFVLVCLSTSNTLLMSVMERIREIGTLLALGTSRAQIGALILFEAQWLGLMGGLAGDALGLAIAAIVEATGVTMPPPPGAVDPIALHVVPSIGDLVAAPLVMCVVLTLAALVPLARTARLRIVDAMGHV